MAELYEWGRGWGSAVVRTPPPEGTDWLSGLVHQLIIFSDVAFTMCPTLSQVFCDINSLNRYNNPTRQELLLCSFYP